MTTSARGRRTGRRQTHSRTSPPVDRLRRNIARGATTRPCRWSSLRRVRRRSRFGRSRSMSRSASRSSAAVIRSNWRWRSASRSAVGALADDDRTVVELRVGVIDLLAGAGRDALGRRLAVLPLVAGLGIHGAFVLGLGLGRIAGCAGLGTVGQTRAAPAPEPGEDLVVDLQVVAPPDEHRRAGGPDLLTIAEVDERQRPGEVDGRSEVGRQAGDAQGPGEPDRAPDEPLDRRRAGSSGRRASAGGSGADRDRWSRASRLSRRRRPRRGSAGRPHRGHAGHPPRT